MPKKAAPEAIKKSVKKPSVKTTLEDAFAMFLVRENFPVFCREYKFHATRKWMFDFAFDEYRIAFEIEGGTWLRDSRHTHPIGYAKDCEKYNEAAILGWIVIRATSDMLKSGLAEEQLRRAFESRKNLGGA